MFSDAESAELDPNPLSLINYDFDGHKGQMVALVSNGTVYPATEYLQGANGFVR